MSGARQGKPKTHAAVEESAKRKSGNGQSSNSQEPIAARRRSATGRSTNARIAATTTSSSKRPTLNAIRSISSQSPPALVAPRSHSSADNALKSNTTHALRSLQEEVCYLEDTTLKTTRRVHASRSPIEAAPATILRQPRGPTQSQSGMSPRHQPSSLSPLARPFVNRASTAPSDGHAATLNLNPAPQATSPPSVSLRTSLPTQPSIHAASDALPAPYIPTAAPAASIEATANEHTPHIAGSHHLASSSALPAQTPAAVDLPAWPLPLPTDPFHHGAYIAMLSLAEKLGAPVNHQLLALALVPTLALYPGSVLRSDNGVTPAPAGAAPSTTVLTTATPLSASIAQVTTTSYTADCPAPSAAMATVPSPAVSVPPPASYVPSSSISAHPPASSVPPLASSAPQATTNSTPVSGQHVQPKLSNHATTASATNSTAVPMSTSTSQGSNSPTTPSVNEQADAASANMDDTSAPPQERKRNRGGKRVWARVEKAKIRDALRAAEARRVEQMKASAATREI